MHRTTKNENTHIISATQTFINADIKQLPGCAECSNNKSELRDIVKCWNSEAARHRRVSIEQAVFQHCRMH